MNVAVVGVSTDSAASHARWKAKMKIPHPLLADTEHTAAEAYGVWVEKSIMGRRSMGVARTTFIIDATGTVVKVFRSVKPLGHSTDVLRALREMLGAPKQ